jgi:hypothetical protein
VRLDEAYTFARVGRHRPGDGPLPRRRDQRTELGDAPEADASLTHRRANLVAVRPGWRVRPPARHGRRLGCRAGSRAGRRGSGPRPGRWPSRRRTDDGSASGRGAPPIGPGAGGGSSVGREPPPPSSLGPGSVPSRSNSTGRAIIITKNPQTTLASRTITVQSPTARKSTARDGSATIAATVVKRQPNRERCRNDRSTAALISAPIGIVSTNAAINSASIAQGRYHRRVAARNVWL